jgi:CHAT domain-containing protein/predicted negative regulator of RcsB-dependent stress response
MKISISGFLRRKETLFVLLSSVILAVVLFVCSCATPSILVTQEQNQGDSFFNSHNYPEAVKHYDLMLNSSKKLGIYRNLTMEANVNKKIANCCEMMGQYDQALIHVRNSMALDSADNNLLGRIEDLRQEGKIYIYMGSYQEGISSVEKSLTLGEGMEQSLKDVHKLTIADNYLALGQLYSVMGRLEKSLNYTGKALNIFRQADDRKGEMESYLTLGSVFGDMGDPEAARNFIKQSMAIAEDLKMGTARHNQLLASVSTSLGEYEDALRYQEKAMDEARNFRIMGQIIWATIGMGDIYRDLGDTRKAERYYKEARLEKDTVSVRAGSLQASLDMRLGDVVSANKYFTAEGSVAGEGISSLRLSEILIQAGRTDSALLMLDQAAGMFHQSQNLQGIANAQLLKGRLLVDKGNYALAKPLLDSASQADEYPETVWQAWFHTGRMYEAQGQDMKAIESYKNSISVIEKIRGNLTIDEFKSIYFDNKRDVYDRLINLMLKNNLPTEGLQFSEQARARAFYDMLSNRKIDFRGATPEDLVSLEQEKRIEMQKLYKLLQKGSGAGSIGGESRSANIRQVRSALTEAQTEYQDIIQKIKLNNPAYADMIAAKPMSLQDIQSRLDPMTAALEYWESSNGLIIWVITHSAITSKIVPVSNTSLNSLIQSTRKAIESNSATEYTSGLSELYKELIGPVENTIASFSNLLIIPNQSLHFLPFQALMNKKGEYLVQKYNLTYSPSASVYVLCNDKLVKTGSKFMGVALSNVSVGDNPGLPGTEDELRKILPLFPDNISAIGMQSSETFVKKNAGNYNFLHFATHGSYNYRQPLYSCLIFPPSDEDDGRLNVFEVFELNLNSKLVTLSACETGLGNLSQGDEITGLSRAFLFAGSASVIVSLWSVADYPTAMLMADFYRYLKNHSMQEALTLAEHDVIKEYPQPVYWSPFVLIGNGNERAD